MSIIEQIRAEVERMKEEEHLHYADWIVGYKTACDDLLSFLSTLQEKSEKPINPTIEKLRALIKAQIRREELNFAALGGGGQTMNIGALEWVLKQLDTLQEQPICHYGDTPSEERCRYCSASCNARVSEQPVCEGLEEEYKNYVENDPVYSKLVNGIVGLSIARHFYELGRQSKPEVSEGLEEAAKAYADDTNPADSFYDAFKEGASWQKEKDDKELSEMIAGAYQLGRKDEKEQMMKEAVEGWLVANGLNDLQVKTANLGDMGYYQGDKVRIVIVKEEGK